MQNSDAKYVASEATFSKMGYKKNDGDIGIKILIPSFLSFVKIKENNDYTIKPLYLLTKEELKKYRDSKDDSIVFHEKKLTHFNVGTVYDATQTNMPLEIINEKLNPVLEDIRADEITDVFVKAIYRDGFKVKYEDNITSGAKGYCDHENKLIVVKKDLGNLMRLKIVVHEYAHMLAHQHLKENNKEYQEHRNQYESEAEGIAYIVCKYLGLDTRDYSMMYLYSWSKEKDFKELDISLNTIVNYSKKIINNYEIMQQKHINMDSMLEPLYDDVNINI